MNVKYTPWEKRNLNVSSSVEYTISKEETWDQIEEIILAHNEEYQVMHIACGNTDVLVNASKNGFFPVEMNIQMGKKLDTIELPQLYKRFRNNISCNISTQEESEYIIDAIMNGKLFTTDKVARDLFFGIEYAGRRYAYWTRDELNNGAKMLSMKYKGQLVAFDVLKTISDDTAEAFLGGVLPEYRDSGLGFIGVYYIAKFAQKMGYKRIITGVSSNNLPILKLHELFGYNVENASYCLIRHI